MKRNSYLLFSFTVCFIFSTVFLKAQQFRTIEGNVRDEKGNPIKNVTVVIKGMNQTANTDENGYYRLDSIPSNARTIIFTSDGKKTASASIGLYDKIDITMVDAEAEALYDLSLEDLLNMEVTTVSKSSEKISDAPGIISVVTHDEIERFGGLTLKEILERVSGLIGSTVYMTDRSIITPRGDQVQPSSSHVLLLINGRPVREILECGIKSEMYESFPVNIIDRIEIIRGPGSVLYGSTAFSAVINVITEKKDETDFSVSGLVDLTGSFGTLAKTNLKIGKVNVIAAGRYLQKSEWKTNWSYALPQNRDTTVAVSIPAKGPGVYFEINYKNLRFISSYDEWETHYSVTDTTFPSAYGISKWKKTFGDLGYRLKLSEKWEMDFNATYTRSIFNVSSWPFTNRNSYEFQGEWVNYWKPSKNIKMVFGGLYNYNDGIEFTNESGEKQYLTDDYRSSFAGYTQLDYAIANWMKVIAGIQANKVEGLDFDFNPRAGFIFYPIRNTNIKILYSQAFRAPSINELSINYFAMMGNPNLKPEKVNTFDVGLNYMGENVYAGLSGYYSKMTNIIYQDRSGKYPVPTYDNIGEVTIKGVEFETKYYFNKNLFLIASILYQTSENEKGEKNVTPIANFGPKAGISYKWDKGIGISIFDIYQGKLDEKYKTSLNPSPGSYNILNLRFDMNIVQVFNIKIKQDISLFVEAKNILDKEIWLPQWGLTLGKSMPVNRGREIYFGLKLDL
jgi:outer membrane receptor protein involved in Fe transport